MQGLQTKPCLFPIVLMHSGFGGVLVQYHQFSHHHFLSLLHSSHSHLHTGDKTTIRIVGRSHARSLPQPEMLCCSVQDYQEQEMLFVSASPPQENHILVRDTVDLAVPIFSVPAISERWRSLSFYLPYMEKCGLGELS